MGFQITITTTVLEFNDFGEAVDKHGKYLNTLSHIKPNGHLP